MAGNKPLHGSLDRLREHLEILDEALLTARKLARPKKGAADRDAIQGLKILRDLVQERNATLDRIQVALLGRDEVGVPCSPQDYFTANQEVEYERLFKRMLTPWTEQDLKIECERCHNCSENVTSHNLERKEHFEGYTLTKTERRNLCPKCLEATQADIQKQEAEAEKPTPPSSP